MDSIVSIRNVLLLVDIDGGEGDPNKTNNKQKKESGSVPDVDSERVGKKCIMTVRTFVC